MLARSAPRCGHRSRFVVGVDANLHRAVHRRVPESALQVFAADAVLDARLRQPVLDQMRIVGFAAS